MKEAFAELGEDASMSGDEQSIPSEFWFVSGDGTNCEAVVKDTSYWGEDSIASPHIVDFGSWKFITESEYGGGSGAMTKLYGVQSGKWYEVDQPYGMWITQDAPGARDFEITADAFDAVEDTVNQITAGHTYKTYYFYYDGAFHEYGAQKITEEEFLQYTGAQAILNDIDTKNSGAVVSDILYRSNGLIHINYSVTSEDGNTVEYYHSTLAVSGEKISETDDMDQPGTYQLCLFPDLN